MCENVNKTDLKELGLSLKILRLRSGKSQYDVAARLGIHPGRLSEMESGRRRPSPDLMERLLSILGTKDIGGTWPAVDTQVLNVEVVRVQTDAAEDRLRRARR